MPGANECSLAQIMKIRSEEDPDRAFALFDNGAVWTQAQTYQRSAELAERLAALGVRSGDRVAIWQPNGPNLVRGIIACSILGATASLLNIAFKGNMLAHALDIADADVLWAHGDLVDRLDSIESCTVKTVVSAEAFALTRTDVTALREAEIAGADVLPALTDPWDIAAIIFTSGTTGASKGVRVTAGQLWSLGQAYYGYLGPEDRMLIMLPLFHIAALGALSGAIARGASISVMESFRPSEFWDVVRKTGATTNVGTGRALLALLLKAPPSPDDRAHKMRRMLVASVDDTVRAFCQRFGCSVFAGYSMSETSVITISEFNPAKNGSVGRPRKGIEVRLVDENDIEVPRGQPGEMIIRASLPWVLNDGYHKNLEATARAWRNGWFHTGDLLVQDEDGEFLFVDRLKDAIRRRGENISSAEVEAEVRAHPAVREAAAIGVETPDGEEVLAVVELMPGQSLEPAELIAFLQPRTPHFMIPRFVRVIDRLPRTETNKVMKPKLRAEGLTPECWDREAAGVKIRRTTLTT
jgi:crotonobetaine/carnitine-CoA ligase